MIAVGVFNNSEEITLGLAMISRYWTQQTPIGARAATFQSLRPEFKLDAVRSFRKALMSLPRRSRTGNQSTNDHALDQGLRRFITLNRIMLRALAIWNGSNGNIFIWKSANEAWIIARLLCAPGIWSSYHCLQLSALYVLMFSVCFLKKIQVYTSFGVYSLCTKLSYMSKQWYEGICDVGQ